MNNKIVKIIVVILVVLMINTKMFLYVKKDFEVLPSDNWSKEIEILSMENGSEYKDFFKNTISIYMSDGLLNIFYLEDKKVIYVKFDNNHKELKKEVLYESDEIIEEIFVYKRNHDIRLVLKNSDKYKYLSYSKDLVKSSKEYEIGLKNTKNGLSDGYSIIKKENGFILYSSIGEIQIDLEENPFSPVSKIVETDIGLDIYYTIFEDGKIKLRHAILDSNYNVIKKIKVATLVSNYSKLRIIDFSLEEKGDIKRIIINTKDSKTGETYLNYFVYNDKNNKLIDSGMLDKFQDNLKLVSDSKLILSMKHYDVKRFVISSYKNNFNLHVYDFNTKKIKMLTKTRLAPRNYVYLEDKFDYLVWTELQGGKQRVYVSSNNPEYIEKSLEFTSEVFFNIIVIMMGIYLTIPIYTLLTVISVLVVVMMFVIPGYLIFLSKFEKYPKIVFAIIIVVHTFAKALIHMKITTLGSLPVEISNIIIPIFIFTTIVGLYSSNIFNKNHVFDHPLVEYIPFFLVDLLLHTLIFGPFITAILK